MRSKHPQDHTESATPIRDELQAILDSQPPRRQYDYDENGITQVREAACGHLVAEGEHHDPSACPGVGLEHLA